MKKTILLLITTLALVGSAAAQSPKASEQSKTKAAKPAKQNHGRFLQSHIKPAGGFGRFQVHTLRVRGLDSPNLSAAIIFDPLTETYTVVGPATGAGLGSAILGAAGNVGSSAVFGMSLRPNRHNENISNNSESEGSSAKATSEGGEATSVSVAEGGDSNAVSVSDADAVSRSSSSASSKNHNKVTSQNTNVNQQSQSNSNSNTNSRKNGNGPKPKTPKN